MAYERKPPTIRAKRRPRPAAMRTEAQERARYARMKTPAICGQCYELIDLYEVNVAIRRKLYPIIHDCGRVLAKGA